MITAEIKNKILSITSVFENGSTKSAYGSVAVMRDGPELNGQRIFQITYGKHQTTEFGKLKALITAYAYSNGMYAAKLRPFVNDIGRSTSLSVNELFKSLLKQAGNDPVMQRIQDEFFDREYWQPAFKFFTDNQFTLPLSMAVIYDSYIHSGGIPSWLRNDFKEVPPAKGGDEEAWITAYVKARDFWLENHKEKLLRNTDYRTDCWLEQIANLNWDLSQPVICKFNSDSKNSWVTIN